MNTGSMSSSTLGPKQPSIAQQGQHAIASNTNCGMLCVMFCDSIYCCGIREDVKAILRGVADSECSCTSNQGGLDAAPFTSLLKAGAAACLQIRTLHHPAPTAVVVRRLCCSNACLMRRPQRKDLPNHATLMASPGPGKGWPEAGSSATRQCQRVTGRCSARAASRASISGTCQCGLIALRLPQLQRE
jgi:hypothetical protein